MGKGGSSISIPKLPTNIQNAANALAAQGAQSLANFSATDPSVQGIINALLGATTYPGAPATTGATPTPTSTPGTSTVPTARGGVVTPTPSATGSSATPTATQLLQAGSGLFGSPLGISTAGGVPAPAQGGATGGGAPTATGAVTPTPPAPGVVPGSYIPPPVNLGVDPASMIAKGLNMATSGGSLAGAGPAMPTPIDFTQFQKGLNLAIDKQTQAQQTAMQAFYGQAGLGNSSMAVSANQNIQDQNLIMKSELGMQLAQLSFQEQATVAQLGISEQQVQLSGRLGMAQLGLDTAQLGANLMQMQQNMGLQLGQFGLQVDQFRTGLNQINITNALNEIGLSADIYNRQATNQLQAQQLNMQAAGNFGVGIGMLGALLPAVGSIFGPVGTGVGGALSAGTNLASAGGGLAGLGFFE